MQQALSAHSEAVKRLSTGRGNAISVGERIRSLGVRSKAPFPPIIVDGDLTPAELEFDDGTAETSELG